MGWLDSLSRTVHRVIATVDGVNAGGLPGSPSTPRPSASSFQRVNALVSRSNPNTPVQRTIWSRVEDFVTRGWGDFSVFDLIPGVGCAPQNAPQDTHSCVNSPPLPSGSTTPHENYIEIHLSNTLSFNSQPLPTGAYSFYPAYFEIFREDWVGDRLLRRAPLAQNQVFPNGTMSVEGNSITITDYGSPHLPLQPGVLHRYLIHTRGNSSDYSTYCSSAEALTLEAQSPGTYDPQNPGAWLERSGSNCVCETRPTPPIPDPSDPQFYTFSRQVPLAGAPSRDMSVQVSRATGLSESDASALATYMFGQAQACQEHLLTRGFQTLPYNHDLFIVVPFADPLLNLGGGSAIGEYNPDSSTLVFSNYGLSNPNSNASSTGACTDPVILHETVHQYTDGRPPLFPFLGHTPDKNRVEYVRNNYLAEGIARYLERDANRSYQTVLESPINMPMVQAASTDARNCYYAYGSECGDIHVEASLRLTCCSANHSGLALALDPAVPALQGLSVSLYADFPVGGGLLLRLSRGTDTELIHISSTPTALFSFRCSDRQNDSFHLDSGLTRNFGIGDSCMLRNETDPSTVNLLLLNRDINLSQSYRLICGESGFSVAQVLNLSDGGSFEIPVDTSLYSAGHFPYEAGACFFEALEHLDRDRFRSLLSFLGHDSGFSTCQSFDAIALFAERMGVDESVIEGMVQRYGFPEWEMLRRGSARTYCQ
ncbi:MAG: hypothetical protein HQM15_05805 [Deltaproteobacteria bacterium]|nr:hypothetical protein [Deltaproteobacteria bacterium]